MKYECLNKLNLIFDNYLEESYTDYNGSLKQEIIINYKITGASISDKITIFSNPFFLYAYKNELKLRIPLINDELKKYFSNYKDYYYLPKEDTCILKSIGAGVDENFRENAKKETCYIKYRGFFIPDINFSESGFKTSYNSKISYIEYKADSFSSEVCIDYLYKFIDYINN